LIRAGVPERIATLLTVSGITKGSATNSLTAHRLSRAAIGFDVVSGSARS
jgi:hypothetical protein